MAIAVVAVGCWLRFTEAEDIFQVHDEAAAAGMIGFFMMSHCRQYLSGGWVHNEAYSKI